MAVPKEAVSICDAGSRVFLALLLLVSSLECASLPEGVDKTHSVSFDRPFETSVGEIFARRVAAHPGESGFAALIGSQEAFLVRMAMAKLAEKTLDAQYYIWESSLSGDFLLRALIDAADRGVRVRVLLDDINIGRRDVTVAAFDLHPNVEIRLFNPLAHRRVRLLSVFDLARVNHRMHNKVFTMDNAITVVGGRNIGDHYFGVDGVSNFRDIDFAALGEIVGEVSVSFDAFWNSPWAIPVSALTGRSTPSREQAQVLHDQKQALLQGAGEFPYRLDSTREELHERLAELKDDLVWAEADVVYDLPDKVGNVGAGGLVETFRDLFASTQEELLIESAYFIPGQEGVALLRELCERGVRVRVLTNSLASNDVAAAHAGYARYRRALIEAGVELHELRADPGSIRSHWSLLAADSRASLHSKALVFDRKAVFVGTLNLDPRSWSINTEIGIVVHGKELAGLVADFLDEGARAENSYTLALQGKRLVWLDEGGQARNSEPDASIWRRIGATMAGWLPIEDQL